MILSSSTIIDSKCVMSPARRKIFIVAKSCAARGVPDKAFVSLTVSAGCGALSSEPCACAEECVDLVFDAPPVCVARSRK